ncbi:hypothetical protein [Corynebacterium ulcerans]|uniref:hypothetical protein n=1 Tax=Corynebacterium ulcerans TaxID=65058 RepID=UPI0034A3E0A0
MGDVAQTDDTTHSRDLVKINVLDQPVPGCAEPAAQQSEFTADEERTDIAIATANSTGMWRTPSTLYQVCNVSGTYLLSLQQAVWCITIG